MRMVLALMAALATSSAFAQSAGPIALRDMGSFHVGGRHIEVTGQPVKEVRFTPGGVPAKVGPIGSWNDDEAKRVTYPGVQFPIDAYEQFMKQGVPRWVTTDEQIIAAYIELVDKVCPCVVLVHSQAGSFGFKVAEARPEKVKALIAVEPSATGSKEKVAALKDIPMVVIYGDNAKDHPRWGKIRQNVVNYAGAVREAGGKVDVIDLPDIGIKGNTHMVMMDKNSDAVADVMRKWLTSKGFVD